jgi:ABC-type multidrug transport system fused ATPase/permease subunit
MGLVRDLWAAAPRRALTLVVLAVVLAGARAAAAVLAGMVLAHRSTGWFVALAAAMTVATLSHLVREVVATYFLTDWAEDVRSRLCQRALGQDLQALESTPVGELLDRIDGDVHHLVGELRASGLTVAEAILGGLVAVATALVVWWPAGMAMAAAIIVLALVLRPTAAAMPDARCREEEAWSGLAAVSEEAIYGQDDVRTSLARPYVLRLVAERSAEILRRVRVAWGLSARLLTSALTITRSGLAVLVLLGVSAYSAGRIDEARLAAAWLLGTGFVLSAERISHHASELLMALGAWDRVTVLMSTPQEPIGGVPPPEGDLVVRGLTFRYPSDQRQAVLHDVDLTFDQGRSYAVVGRTGSGKSTLAKVITRSVDVPPGTVFLGNVDLADVDLHQLRRTVALVPQSTELVTGTLADNITLFDPELRPLVADALEQLGATSWVAELPDGIETRLGEGGTVLSAGQEQLVAFARILIRQPRVVILDEATARLDPATEQRIRAATAHLLEGRIGIVIAHRLATVEQCDEVVVLADGKVAETGPLTDSIHVADLVALSRGDSSPAPDPLPPMAGPAHREMTVAARTDPPPVPPEPPARTIRETIRLASNDPSFGLVSFLMWLAVTVLSLEGAVIPWLFAAVVDGSGSVWPPALLLATGLAVGALPMWVVQRRFPEWWVRQMLRINLRLVHGQTGPRRVSRHTPAEVVAQAGDTERVVFLADHLFDQAAAAFLVVLLAMMTRSVTAVALFGSSMALSGLVAAAFRRRLTERAADAVSARARFATMVSSTLTAARSIKLAGASRPVLAELARLERIRDDQVRQEAVTSIAAQAAPGLTSGLLPLVAWALYLDGGLDEAAVLATVATLGAAHWYSWTTASLVSRIPSARVWTKRTVTMAGCARYSAAIDGVDLGAGTATAPPVPARAPLQALELIGFSAVHDDGTIGVRGVDLTIERGQLVVVMGPVGSGKSSLLRALAGIVHHDGHLLWNGQPVDRPELFLRPQQVGYVGQLPRVLSGTIADNVSLGHQVDVVDAVDAAQLRRDLAVAGSDLDLVIGHKGTRLSGGQLQRLALARALAPGTELLVADDVSSALDVATELELWKTLRERGVTTVASSSRLAAVVQADVVVVLVGGEVVESDRWVVLADRWGHLTA